MIAILKAILNGKIDFERNAFDAFDDEPET